MSEKQIDAKQLHVFIDVQAKDEKKASRFKFFKKRKDTSPARPSSPVLPLVKFDSQGDFSKEKLESNTFAHYLIKFIFYFKFNS